MADPIQLRIDALSIIDQATPDHADDDFDVGVRGYPHAARFSDGTLYAHFYVSPWLNRQTRPVNCISLDGGRTWGPPRPMPIGPASEPLVLEDDTLLYFNELCVEDPHRIVGTRCETRDRGATFHEDRAGAVFQLPEETSIDLKSPRSYWGQCEQFVYQYGFLREGEIVWTLLGAHCNVGAWCRLMLFRSADGARTFDYVSTIGGATDPGHGGFTEPTMARMTDGSLLVVARTEYPHDDWRYLASFRSIDDGATWEEEGVPAGVPPVYRIRSQRPLRNEGKMHANAGNVSPSLMCLDNGIAVLAFGRPGQKVAFSADGVGRLWTDTLRIVPEESLFGRNDQTSGMTGLVPVGHSRFVFVFDVAGYRSSDGAKPADTVFALEISTEPAPLP